MQLNLLFAQNLCDLLHAELSLVCSFMGASGHIVASSERSRIGQPHEIARRVMAGEMDEYRVSPEEAAHSSTVREGVNTVITLGGERVTCLAIAGPLPVVVPLARIVSFCVTALLQIRLGYPPAPPGQVTSSAPAANLSQLLRHASATVEFSLERLSQTINHIDQGLSLFDRDLRLVVWNQRFLDLIGWPAGAISLGQPMDELLAHFADYVGHERGTLQPMLERRVQRLRAGKRNDFEYTSPQGVVLAISDQPLPDGSMVSTYTDVTTRHQADAQLREAHATAEQLVQQLQERSDALSRQLNLLQQLIESIPGPLFYKDAQGRYLGCNSAFADFVGRNATDLLGKTPFELAPTELAQRYTQADQQLLAQSGRQIYESQVRHTSGAMHDVIFHKATFSNPDGSVAGLVGFMLDITERKRMEDELRQAATFFNNSAEGMTVARPDGTIVAVNRAFTTITGYSSEEALGQTPRMLQSGRHGPQFYTEMWDKLLRHGRWQGEVWNRRKSGDIYPQWLSIVAVYGAQGQVTHYVATFSDITLQKQNEERIQQLAFTDVLTGLPNRRLLLDRLEHALVVSNRNHHRGALFFIDIDDFKGLNDTRGHYVGDLLLQQVATRLQGCVSDGDTVARLGGDEFVVMLEGLSAEALQATGQAEIVGTRILHALSAPYQIQDGMHHHSASLGVALFGQEQASVDDILKQADMAMYRAKAAGRNTLRFFDPQMQSALAERVALEGDLRAALAGQGLVLHYQPQVTRQGDVVGVEALVRWQRGSCMVPPGDFITLAEETGLILPLGQWVLETACRQLAAWADTPAYRHLVMAVNVSARQFHNPGFVAQVLDVLDRTDANPRLLKLELTESLLITNVEDVIAKMSVLKERGVCFSLDDFGTGYSSLSYLKRLPLDQLKIDQSFVQGLLDDVNDAAIAGMVVALGASLGLEVIAEGVESAAQRDFLARLGCYHYQGYFFSRPLPAATLPGWIDAQPGSTQQP